MAFSSNQQVALAVTPKVTAFLSIIGSGWVVVEVLTQREKRQNVYNRLLCAMSIADMISSSLYFTSTWPMPEGTEGIAWAVGDEKTCSAQGFILQVGIVPPIYNCCLAIYYMLVVNFGVTEHTLRRYVEPSMHLFAILFGLSTATAGLFLDLYNNANLWCWIAELPAKCEDSFRHGETTCIRGDNAWIYRWAFYFAPLWFIILLVTIIMIFVYQTVRKREIDAEAADNGDEIVRASRSSAVAAGGDRASRRRLSARISQTGQVVRTKSIMMPKKMAEIYRSGLSLKKSADDDEGASYVMETLETFATARQQNVEMNQYGSRAVFQQSFYYTTAFYVTYTFATVNRILQQVNGETYFPVIYLHSLLLPLQGLFNVLIYRYQFFFRMKQRHPHMRKRDLLRLTYRWSFLGPPRDLRMSKMSKYSLEEVSKRASTSLSNATNFEQCIVMDGENSSRGENGGVNILADDLSPVESNPVDNMMADMLVSYADFPNMLSEDAVLVSTEYPAYTNTESFSRIPAPDFSQFHPLGGTGGPQAYPTMVNDPDTS